MALSVIPKSIRPASSVKLYGVGNSSSPFIIGDANKNGIGLWLKTVATSGDCRAIYARMYFTGAGGGEAVRAYGTANTTNVATGGTVNGLHASLNLAASASISGQGFASRHTVAADADTRTISGNVAAIRAESDFATGNTIPATVALIHLGEIGNAVCKKAFRFPTIASAGMVAAHITDAMTHSVRCVDDAGTVFYLMATTTSSNRTGGA